MSSEVGQYRVETSMTLNSLIERVNMMIGMGWKVCGGISVNNSEYYQAMTSEKRQSTVKFLNKHEDMKSNVNNTKKTGVKL